MKFLFAKLSVILFLLGFNNFQGNGQGAKVTWGPVLKEPKKTNTTKIIGNDASGFFTLRENFEDAGIFNPSARTLFLERYDLLNKMVFSKELIIPAATDQKGRYKLEDIFYLNGQLILFSSYMNKETGVNTAFANKVNTDGSIPEKPTQLSSIVAATKRNTGEFEFKLSNDSTKILVFNKMPYEKNEQEKFEFRVIDQHLETIFQKSITLSHLDKKIDFSNYQVDNQGNVYVLMTTKKNRNEQTDREQNIIYTVLGYFINGDQSKEYEIKLPQKFISDVTFNIDKNLNLIVAGFCGDDKKLNTNSSFFLKVNFETKNMMAQGVKAFSPEFLELFMSKTKAKRKNAGVPHMSLDQLKLQEDGGALLVAEQAYDYVVTTRSGPGGGVTTTTHYYVNNDLVFVNFYPDGTIKWVSRIPKKQTTANDLGYYSSYSLSTIGDKMYLIYNENVKNLDKPTAKKYAVMNRPSKSVTVLVTVDASGKFIRTPLFPAADKKTIVRPRFYFQTGNSLIIYSETRRDYRYGTITFK